MKRQGSRPIPMMDRDTADDLPAHQVEYFYWSENKTRVIRHSALVACAREVRFQNLCALNWNHMELIVVNKVVSCAFGYLDVFPFSKTFRESLQKYSLKLAPRILRYLPSI